MNTIIDEENSHLRYAEYVLGVLDADERAAVAHEAETSDEAATAVALWQQRLLPMIEGVEAVAPADYVWARISDSLQLERPAPARPRQSLWQSLPLWRYLTLGATVVAAILVVIVSLPQAPAPKLASPGYLAATIQQDNGSTGWTATMDLQHSRMIVVPATPLAMASDRDAELWLIPPGGKPIPVGLIARNQPTTISLDATLLAKIGPSAALAVSVEPLGGSPTGQPTGPVIAKGAISGAPDNGHRGKPVAILRQSDSEGPSV